MLLHLPYNPEDMYFANGFTTYMTPLVKLPLKCIHNEETGDDMNINKFTIVYSHSKNLRDLLYPAHW